MGMARRFDGARGVRSLPPVPIVAFLASSLLVFLGVPWGMREPGHQETAASVMCFDAEHYRHICENGYSYSPERASEVAFFPAFPLAAGPQRADGALFGRGVVGCRQYVPACCVLPP